MRPSPFSPKPGSPKEGETWPQRWQTVQIAMRNIPKAFRLVWQAAPWSTVGMACVTLLAAGLPATQAWVGKLIVDSVVDSLRQASPPSVGLRATLPFLFWEFGLIVLAAILSQTRTLLEHLLNSALTHTVNSAIIRKALALDLHYFEDAEFYDKLQNARRQADFRAVGIVNTNFLLIQGMITLLSIVFLLLSFSPLITLILFGATLPSFIVQTRYSHLYFRLLTWRAPEFRRMMYLEYLLTADVSIKEVKLFGLGEPLMERYEKTFWQFHHEDATLAQRRSLLSVLWGLLATTSYYGAYLWIVWRTIARTISLGDMTLYLALFRQSQMTFQGIIYNLNQLYESGLFMDNLFGFLDLQPQMPLSAQPQPLPRPIKQGITFQNVSFRYPETTEWALHNVSLHIPPGQKIALVGTNGAGKTTLVKLLTRLYDPLEGQILFDGIDIREFELADLRASIGVIFQDFVHYQTTARENIGFGQIDALADDAKIKEAAKRGGADELITALPEQYETMLGKQFHQGHELSGGQWQKIALSRAFMREGEILILDEPTAALDAEREYEIFQRFRELTQGKMALLISHRFSTVRMADRIAVLEGGKLTELGTHEELVALGQTYARLFQLQAEGYR